MRGDSTHRLPCVAPVGLRSWQLQTQGGRPERPHRPWRGSRPSPLAGLKTTRTPRRQRRTLRLRPERVRPGPHGQPRHRSPPRPRSRQLQLL